MRIDKCPACLKSGFETYCNSCLKKLFGGKKVNHYLDFTRPEFNSAKLERSDRLSISGVQIKHSLKLEKNKLILTEKDGEYILKPIPGGMFKNLDQVPYNEHLTMQIASQIYKIDTALNAIAFFADEEPAYIAKRFDKMKDGKKTLQEDFAQIAGRTEETNGKNYKYDFSYEEIAELMKLNVKPYQIEVEKYFRIIIFNYLFSNGDAHLKNFSLYRNEEYGDYLLTKFYDLLNTSIHVPGESDLALGLFKDNFETDAYKAGSKYTKPAFEEFAEKIGINQNRFTKIYDAMLDKSDQVKEMINASFLRDDLKEVYYESYVRKLERLRY
jgi:serine/threonine-protein kinase HipA